MKDQTRIRLTYIVADYVAANIGWLLFNVLRYHLLPMVQQGFFTLNEFLGNREVWLGQVGVPLLMLAIFYLSGFYNRVFLKSRLQIVLTTLGSAALTSLIAFLAMLVNDLVTDRIVDYYVIFSLLGLIFICVVLPRLIIAARIRRKIDDGKICFPTVVIGTGHDRESIARRLEKLGGSRMFTITGYIDASDTGVNLKDVPSFGQTDIERLCSEGPVTNIILISENWSPPELLRMVNRLFPLEKHIYISPDAAHILTSRLSQSDIKGEPLIDISRSDMPDSTVNLKRLADIVVSSLSLLLLSPLFAVLALLVRYDSPGPAIYSQKRIGRHKSEFDIYKFRTMYTDAESHGPALSSEEDPRVTRIGRVLRKYRLDELPQFWNVLKGDMSLVGPRPEREYFIRQIVEKAPYYTLLHQVRPGITSWGMVKYGYAQDVDSMIERSRYDLLYIENISFAVDMKIILHTVQTVLTGKGI